MGKRTPTHGTEYQRAPKGCLLAGNHQIRLHLVSPIPPPQPCLVRIYWTNRFQRWTMFFMINITATIAWTGIGPSFPDLDSGICTYILWDRVQTYLGSESSVSSHGKHKDKLAVLGLGTGFSGVRCVRALVQSPVTPLKIQSPPCEYLSAHYTPALEWDQFLRSLWEALFLSASLTSPSCTVEACTPFDRHN